MKKIIFTLTFLFAINILFAQKKNPTTLNYDTSYFSKMKWRCIGPFRGGRSAAVTGVRGNATTFYFGGTGGGVWKSVDGGSIWKNISDTVFGGSIGAVTVSESDPNVIYAGEGEGTVRGNTSEGRGIWKSLDAGKTWTFIGLKDSRHIPKICVHPKNPDLVYVAALGHLFGDNSERGVYRSKDGGKNWERILFVSNRVGAVDLILDPVNPRIIFASMWNVRRNAYSMESGGAGSGLWRSTDGGDTWRDISRNKGLPEKDTLGIIGISVSPVNHERVWAIIEAANGGVFRSDDGGENWTKTNESRDLRQRAWYFSKIYADTKEEDVVYVLNVQFHKSKDGGKTFKNISTPHGDHHALWIDPENNSRMIIGDDGGAQITFDGGENWSSMLNQPTAQFYRVSTDNHFPYRILGAQQDNSSVRILSRSNNYSINERDWEPTAGGESGFIVAKPDDDDVVYGGEYDGYFTRINHRTNEENRIDVWPDNPMGWGAADLKYRFQWNFPIFISPHDPNVLYAAGNVLFKTNNEGQSWEIISPDLTRNDKTKMTPSGGPITKDNTSIEYYGTIFAAAESPIEKGIIWTGSDDGIISLTKDGGKNWENVTPKNLPEWTLINCIEINPFKKGSAYIAGTRYKSDDFSPYLFKTDDYGKTWSKITNGIENDHFTRVIRTDQIRQGLLFCGTEYGMYVSFDDGQNWMRWQLNFPIVPITDLTLKNGNLIAATQGRSFWVLDDLSVIRQMSEEIVKKEFHFFKPDDAIRMDGGWGESKTAGKNPPNGVTFNFYFKNLPDTVKGNISLEILDSQEKVIKKIETKTKVGIQNLEPLQIEKGMNNFIWDMRYEDAEKIDGAIFWAGNTTGPKCMPGNYKAKITVTDSLKKEKSETVSFEIKPDPNAKATAADYQSQFDFLLKVRDKLSETHKGIKDIRDIRQQINDWAKKVESDSTKKIVVDTGKAINKKLDEVEENLIQTKSKSPQDPINFPIKLNDKLSGLSGFASSGNYPPSKQALDVYDELSTKIDVELKKLKTIIENDLQQFNKMVKDLEVPAVILKKEEKKSN